MRILVAFSNCIIMCCAARTMHAAAPCSWRNHPANKTRLHPNSHHPQQSHIICSYYVGDIWQHSNTLWPALLVREESVFIAPAQKTAENSKRGKAARGSKPRLPNSYRTLLYMHSCSGGLGSTRGQAHSHATVRIAQLRSFADAYTTESAPVALAFNFFRKLRAVAAMQQRGS